MGRYQEIYDKLSDGEKTRSGMLGAALTELGVRPGMQEKLQCRGHFGRLQDPIWKYIYMLRTTHQWVKDKGAWLVKCLDNERK